MLFEEKKQCYNILIHNNRIIDKSFRERKIGSPLIPKELKGIRPAKILRAPIGNWGPAYNFGGTYFDYKKFKI